ncbi:unnamed protein product [Mytilus coruscus]|uniref:Uncharacterized protein n=1 Tax=Mytilus coruscus TaxID=42192 RepID=A0A6J8CIE6_MYTCO|nr:unnamed protein product [Mytilus coruscus]
MDLSQLKVQSFFISFYQKLWGLFVTTKIFVHPDIEIVQEGDNIGCFTYTAVSRNNGNRGSNQKPASQSSNKSCQTNTDNLNYEFLKMYDQWSDFTYRGEGYSLLEGNPEYEGPFYHGLRVEIKSHSKKKFVFDGHAAILESVTFTSDAPLQERDTCIIFSWKNNLYSPSAIRKIIIENETDGDSFDIMLFSEREGKLRIETLSDVFTDTAFQVAKNLQNLNDGRQIRKLKDVLLLLDPVDQRIQITNFNKPSNTQQKREMKENNNIRANYKSNVEQQRSKSIKAGNIDEQYGLSKIQKCDRTFQERVIIIQKKTKNTNLNITDTYFEKPLPEKTKTNVQSHGIFPTKMKNSKVKTQTKHPEWKIYLRPGEDDIRNLVSDYFGDDMIRQAVYGMLGHDVDRRYKASFERPNVPWPSMHPLLPYKLRFLDDDVDHNRTRCDHFTGDFNTQQQDNHSSATEQGDSCEESECGGSLEISDENHLNITSTDENDSDCDQSN